MAGYSDLAWFRSENAAGFFLRFAFSFLGSGVFFRSFSLSLFFSSSFALAAGSGALSSFSVRPAAGHRTDIRYLVRPELHPCCHVCSFSSFCPGRPPSPSLPPSFCLLSLFFSLSASMRIEAFHSKTANGSLKQQCSSQCFNAHG